MMILKVLVQPRSSPLHSQEISRLTPYSSTHCRKVGAALPFFLMDPREHFQFKKRQLDFSSKRLPLGPNHNGACDNRTQNYVSPQGKVTSSRRKKKKRVLLIEAEFCLHWKLKTAKEKKKHLILWASKSRVFSMSSPEIPFFSLNLSPSSRRSTSSKNPLLTSRPSFIHLSMPVAPRLWPPQPFADAWQHPERARFPIRQAWQIAPPSNVRNNSRLLSAMLVSLNGGKVSPWGQQPGWGWQYWLVHRQHVRTMTLQQRSLMGQMWDC